MNINTNRHLIKYITLYVLKLYEFDFLNWITVNTLTFKSMSYLLRCTLSELHQRVKEKRCWLGHMSSYGLTNGSNNPLLQRRQAWWGLSLTWSLVKGQRPSRRTLQPSTDNTKRIVFFIYEELLWHYKGPKYLILVIWKYWFDALT